jgi:CheY-like chemotaxis protein
VTTLAVVEDNADNRLLLQAILDDQYDLVEYDNGVDALAGLDASLPELVLLDISLPGMDGNEILARIRADARLRHLPVIALTAHAMSGDREKYLAAGFNDYVTKPIVDEAILIGAIEKWLAASRSGGLG